ncbi:MAG: transcriptional regulator NrdR [Thermoflexales bacterium]
MKCPTCGSAKTHIVDTTPCESGHAVRRRRECLQCGKRFSTLERVVYTTPLVVKRDGRRELFNRDKLARGIRIACAKRPVATEVVDRVVGKIEAKVVALSKPEVPSHEIGTWVLEELKALDEVAYIRFAIVYLELKDLESVQKEIAKILSER